jgi:hypothetical protein
MKYWLPGAVLLFATHAQAKDAAAPATEAASYPVRTALSSTSAFGVTGAGFFNQLLGVRLDYRFTQRFALGGVLSYTNLEGKERRVHNLLPEVRLEYRTSYDGERFGIPLHFGVGYLAKNGPTLRLGAGVDFALAERVSMEVLPLEPMVWVNRERPEVSMNGSLSLRLAF